MGSCIVGQKINFGIHTAELIGINLISLPRILILYIRNKLYFTCNTKQV
jgi:hypothetical protein